ncbi:MAG: S1C family serine protease [Thermodesulfovibrionia bacterium]|nr:S1C family serine protease [Thermodesulfovibrionia bacterium]
MKKIKANHLLIFLSMITILFSIPLLSHAKTAREIAQNSFPSVVMLLMEDSNGQPLSLGSGFFVREGIVATNLHVIEGAAKGYVKIVAQKLKYDIAGILGIDKEHDLVLLSIKGAKAPSLSLGDGQQVAVGDEVYAVGNPQGLEGTFSQGIISSIRQVASETILQITTPISPGSSGGPVLNVQGTVIGVAVATFKGGQNLNFAIPISYLSSLLQNIKPLMALSGKTRSKQDKSILDGLGERSVGGVVGGQLTWTYSVLQSGDYAFSFRNQLREPVKDIYCLVVFYDRADNPIDVNVVRYSGVIPAGLAKRVTSRVDESVQKLTSRVEFRILDFKIIE